MRNKASIQTDVLWNISKALNYDFFEHISNALNSSTENSKTKQQQFNEMQQQIIDLQKEVAIYKDLLKSR